MKSVQATSRVLTTERTSPCAQPDMDGWLRFAVNAEEAGIESVLLSFSRYEPDTLMIACALGRATRTLKFIAAYRSGLMQPTTFVQQLNTLSGLIQGRVAVNIVAGSSPAEQRGYGDFLDHDDRYARAEEFLAICDAFWSGRDEVDFKGNYYRVEHGRMHVPFTAPDRAAPEIYISGHSPQAEHLALSRGSCWLRLIDTPEALGPLAARVRGRGGELCLRLGLICRPTREEAIRAAESMLPEEAIGERERGILNSSDSRTLQGALETADKVGWMNRHLWAGLVPYYGSSAITLLGSPVELCEAFLEYQSVGITQFIISGWPKLEEMLIFGREVLPLIRDAESRREMLPGGMR